MKKLVYILLILLTFENGFSQVIDTCFIGDTVIYHVKNQLQNSWLIWEITDGEIISENPSKADSIVILWNVNAGIYELSVYEKTKNNCKGKTMTTGIMVIEKDFDIELNIPNVFTPNGDGKNDYFTITANHPPENYSITIINRWGNKVFETENINTNWDGKTKDRDCNSGVYYYIINYKNGNKIETKNGFLHVFK